MIPAFQKLHLFFHVSPRGQQWLKTQDKVFTINLLSFLAPTFPPVLCLPTLSYISKLAVACLFLSTYIEKSLNIRNNMAAVYFLQKMEKKIV
jgi:hypothetical protein